MDHPTGAKNTVIMIQETGRGQAFPGAAELKLGIRKGDPNLAYFSGSKIVFQSLDLDPQKSEIFHLFLKRGFRTTPQSRSLDIDADEVLFRHFPALVYSRSAEKTPESTYIMG